MAVRYGITTDFVHIKGLENAGFDYIEPKMYDIGQATEQEFAAMVHCLAETSVKCEAVNLFYPQHFHVVGEGIDLPGIHAYIEKAVDRAARLGVRHITIGSGGPRTVPDGFDPRRAFEQFGEQVRHAGKCAARHDITISVEQMSPRDCNLITTIKDCAAMVEFVNLPNVGMVPDNYQMAGGGDSADDLYKYGRYVRHLHINGYRDRSYPVDPENAEMAAYVKAYLSLCPNGRITAEGADYTTEAEAARCLAALRAYVEKALATA